MPRIPNYTEDDVRAAVANARSLSDALKALGLRAAGGNFKTLRGLIEKYEIPTEHLDSNWSRRAAPRVRPRIPLSEAMVERSTYDRHSLKQRLYDEGLKARICEICGQTETWNGVFISLVLDHINGEHDANRLENLRIVCPNCNAGLDTHCGRKNQNGPRTCLHCGKEFLPKTSNQQYCSQICGVHYRGRRDPKPHQRKVERPSYEVLMQELAETNYSAVGRRYGVSDNAVRKWVRAYEYQRQRAAEAAEVAKSGDAAGDDAGAGLTVDTGPPEALAA